MTYTPELWLDYLRKEDSELVKLCRVDIYKATGRGGQKKNKTSNAIRLTLGNLSTTESQSRSRLENIAGAVKKMRFAIATDLPSIPENTQPQPPPTEIKPYLNHSELRINPKNPAFPIFIGFMFRRFLAHQGDWTTLAEDLGTSNSQVRKFIERNASLKRVLSELQTKIRGGGD